MQQTLNQQKASRKKSRKPAKRQARPAIEPTRLYNRSEAAIACGVAGITLWRAYSNGTLKAYRVGSRVSHSGQHLLDWLESGGRTGRTAADLEQEREKK
jgi:hypothetical protein